MAVTRRDRWCLCRRFQPLLQLSQTRLGLCISIGLRRVGVHDEGELAREVINHRQLFGLQQQDVGHAQIIGRARVHEFLFDMAHGVVTKVACQAAAKTWQSLTQRHFETLLVVGHKIERVACVSFDHHAIGHHLGLRGIAKTTCTQQRTRWQTNEAVTPKALTAHHGFEQEAALAIVLYMRQLEVQRERGF